MFRKSIWLLFAWTLLPKTIQTSNAQSNGEKKATFLTDDELERIERERTRNVVRLAATDMLNSEIVTNRTRAYLSCESGEMIVKINFNAPFRGVAYANYDRSSHCKFYGDGSTYYEMIIPLKGCGTKQEAPRLFLNNIIFRFHRTLELEEDEIKTIICRYPPPLAPPPVDPVPPILEPTSPTPIILPTKLSEIELLLIICGLLFLTLLLLGIGIAYYCLKRRNIKIVRKKKLSTGPPSEITKLSQSTVFDQIRIPRATAHSTESSETIPSDYPSESLSEDERRTIVSETSTMRQDQYKYANAAFIPEPYPMDVEKADSISNIPVPAMHKPNITTKNFMTTILETQHFKDENIFNTTNKRTISQLYKKFPTKYAPPSIPDNDIPEAGSEIIEEIPRRKYSIPWSPPSLKGSIPDDDVWSHSEVDEAPAVVPYVKRKKLEMATADDTFINKEELADVTEDTTHNKVIVYPPPKILLKQIDDLYVTNISEKTTTDFVSKKSASKSLPSISQLYSPQLTREILDVYTEDVERFKSDASELVYMSTRSIPDYDAWSHSEVGESVSVVPYMKRKRLEVATAEDTLMDREQLADITEHTTHNKVIAYPPSKAVTKQIDDLYLTNVSTHSKSDFVSKRSASKSLPSISSQLYSPQLTREILDVYTEDVERFKSDASELVDVSTRSKTREIKSRTQGSIITSLMGRSSRVDRVEQLTPDLTKNVYEYVRNMKK